MRRQKGFTLIELLIVVAIIGIIAAIAIPNLLNAINRGRQKRTMADIRSIATAIESYQVDFNFFPKGLTAGGTIRTEGPAYLTPTYIKRIPGEDGWNQPICAQSNAAGTTYSVWSLGKGNANACAAYSLKGSGGATTDFADDMIFSEGRYTQWPEGMQTN
jgi:general secretion pathway protein G